MFTLTRIRPNFASVSLGNFTVWFSYSTPIAFWSPTTGYVLRENSWGPTTGRHLNDVVDHKRTDRVPGPVFTRALEAAWKEAAK